MNLKKKILTKFNSKNFQFRDNDKEIIFFLDNQTNFVPYLNSFFRWKFNLEQILDKYKEVYDFSGILRFNNEDIGFWPITYIKDINKFTSYGSNILNPIFKKNIDKVFEKKICNSLFDILNELCNELNVKEFQTEENFHYQDLFISNWHTANLNYFPEIQIEYQIYVNLKLGYEKIRSFYRKSYKSLINKSKKKLEVKILDIKDKVKYFQFKNLHEIVSGKQTRSKKSWELNFSEIENLKSYLFYVEDDSSKIIGGTIINCSDYEAYYAIGAYDRSYYNDLYVSHLIQDFILDFLCKNNFKWYNLGEYDPASYKKNKKLYDISKFKMGFCTNLKTKYIFTHKV
jgi:FemAB family protein